MRLRRRGGRRESHGSSVAASTPSATIDLRTPIARAPIRVLCSDDENDDAQDNSVRQTTSPPSSPEIETSDEMSTNPSDVRIEAASPLQSASSLLPATATPHGHRRNRHSPLPPTQRTSATNDSVCSSPMSSQPVDFGSTVQSPRPAVIVVDDDDDDVEKQQDDDDDESVILSFGSPLPVSPSPIQEVPLTRLRSRAPRHVATPLSPAPIKRSSTPRVESSRQRAFRRFHRRHVE